MKLLIIGGSSFIGKNVIEECVNFKDITECSATRTNNVAFDNWAKKNGVEPITLDLTKKSKNSFDKYDAAIYLSGNSNHGIAAEDPILDNALNTGAMLNFLEIFHGRLVYLSSAATYFGLAGHVTPHTLPRPTFAYGISKLSSEYYINSKLYSKQLTSAAIVRLYYSFGRHDKQRRILPQVFSRVDNKDNEILRVHGDGNSYMNPLIASFVAKALIKLAINNSINGTFDLCGNNNKTVIELIHYVSKLLGHPIKAEGSGKQEDYPVLFHGNADPLLSMLKLSYPDYDQSILDAFDWFKTTQND